MRTMLVLLLATMAVTACTRYEARTYQSASGVTYSIVERESKPGYGLWADQEILRVRSGASPSAAVETTICTREPGTLGWMCTVSQSR